MGNSCSNDKSTAVATSPGKTSPDDKPTTQVAAPVEASTTPEPVKTETPAETTEEVKNTATEDDAKSAHSEKEKVETVEQQVDDLIDDLVEDVKTDEKPKEEEEKPKEAEATQLPETAREEQTATA